MSRTNLACPRRTFNPLLVVVVLTAATTLLSTAAVATDSSAAAEIDHRSAVLAAGGGGPANDINSSDVNDDETLDINDHQYAALFGGLRPGDDDDGEDAGNGVDKRKSKIAAWRSDLGKRSLGDELEDMEKRAYRMRGGKAFKADLGKRARGATMFRSDLGRRSDPSLTSDPRRLLSAGDRSFDGLAFDGLSSSIGELPADAEGESHEVDRRRTMFRSDLGKRSTRGDSVRRMFRADLGKRRVSFRHDLG